MSASMTGLFFLGEGRAELDSLPVPEPGPTEVRIAVRASGLCGSDLMSYRWPRGLRHPSTDAPIVVGHEPAGVVEAVGRQVSRFAVGDRVLAYHILGCGLCHPCRLGYPVNCVSPAKAAYGGQRHGGHADYMTAEERSLIAIPPGVSFVDGATLACGTSTAYAATRRAAVSAGDRVLITGLGPVGLAVAMFAADAGAEVIGADPNQERAAFARQHGVHHTITSADPGAAVEQLREITADGSTVGIECSGTDAGRALLLAAAATWGRVVFVGFGGGALTLDVSAAFIVKQLSAHGSWVSSLAQMEDATALLRQRDLHPDALVTRSYALAEAAQAYRDFSAGSVGKLVVATG
jgi:threonine dehydrogenase-like Zn-dependent dehydrogenase